MDFFEVGVVRDDRNFDVVNKSVFSFERLNFFDECIFFNVFFGGYNWSIDRFISIFGRVVNEVVRR